MYSFDDSFRRYFLSGVCTVFLSNIMELPLLGSVNQKFEFQKLSKITDKTKNILSLHNSPRHLTIWSRLLLRFCSPSALYLKCYPAEISKVSEDVDIQVSVRKAPQVSYSHRTIQVGRDLERSSSATPCYLHLKGGSPIRSDQASQDFIHWVLKTSKGGDCTIVLDNLL